MRSYRPDIADAVRATLNLNLPGSVAQHYHIDDAYLKEFLICNVAVVDTDLANGAIDVLPGTNREFYKFWRYALERKYRLTTRVPLQRGDVDRAEVDAVAPRDAQPQLDAPPDDGDHVRRGRRERRRSRS